MAYLRTEIRLGMTFQYYRDCSIAIGISTVLAKISSWQGNSKVAKHK